MDNKQIFVLLLLSCFLSFSTAQSPEASPSPSLGSPHFPSKDFFSSSTANAPLPPVDPTLEKICSVTENPHKCISIIAPYTSGPTDAVSILNMIIEAIYKQVERAITISDKATQNPSQSSVISSCLDKCVESYNKVIDDLGKAMAASSSHDISAVNTMLSAAISNFGLCDEAFHKNGLADSPMKEIDESLIELAGFGVDISKKLIRKSN
ncbi:hypothetical protein P3X46_001368 [Hevea brasiliensis]|uniref:Pectinesterase inhibitor domain-containing protein n=1 Tax=Hevea brasiliensis TaxID=3981 RepID=A0ABQ9NDW7_HEVBR|nr:uncharacterized protein LOC110649143 [Hevea brasiliensis]KAJ9190140.1 hypothetical protein P3X46_001368 [Hevea brasiliensis]